MAEQNANQDKFSPDEQKTAFLQAIHAPTIEEKGRVLQQHPELTNIVNVYDEAVNSHQATNEGFQAEFKSGRYEAMLANDILKGNLKMYDAAAERLPEAQLAVINKIHDKQSGMLQGFDINLGSNEKPLHIDLQNYSPQGKTPAETKQLREDFVDIYQSAIKKNPEDAERNFKTITQLFPQGIVWRGPEQELNEHLNTKALQMQGVPNLGVVASKGYGQAFIRLHEERANSPLKHGEIVMDSFRVTLENLQGAAVAINKGGYFTDEQKIRLNTIFAEQLKESGISLVDTHVLDNNIHRTV